MVIRVWGIWGVTVQVCMGSPTAFQYTKQLLFQTTEKCSGGILCSTV